jgi:hypothetical protein
MTGLAAGLACRIQALGLGAAGYKPYGLSAVTAISSLAQNSEGDYDI